MVFVREIPKPHETTYSWRKNFQKNFGESKDTKDENHDHDSVKSKERNVRILANIAENFYQSPTMSILQIKLAGETRLSQKPPSESTTATVNNAKKKFEKEIVKSTCDVDVQEKREIFEGKQEDHERLKFRKIKRQESFEAPPKSKTGRESWNALREKHCPITTTLVDENKGESLRSSILGDQKISFRNLKFTPKPVSGDPTRKEETKNESIASSKEFEDTATAILNQMRKQRRTLQMEYVSKVRIMQSAFK